MTTIAEKEHQHARKPEPWTDGETGKGEITIGGGSPA